MKLTKEQKAEFATLAEMSKEAGIDIVTYPDLGTTIGWYRNFKNSKMITVAVSYLDTLEGKKFRAKTGAYFVLQRLFDVDCSGQAIQLPLGHLSYHQIQEILADTFGNLNAL